MAALTACSFALSFFDVAPNRVQGTSKPFDRKTKGSIEVGIYGTRLDGEKKTTEYIYSIGFQ
jgi:hypothetical protein